MNPDDFPDLTLSELKESDEYDTEELGAIEGVEDTATLKDNGEIEVGV